MIELTLGREEGNRRLKITTADGNTSFLGQPNSVPNSVSRQHCKLQINSKDDIIITNLKPENKTLVNGLAIMTKHVKASDTVELGKELYKLNLATIADVFLKQQKYSISHLEKVWKDYKKARMDAQIAQTKENNISSVTGLFSMSAIIIGFIPGVPMWLRIVIYAIGLGLAAFFFYRRMSRAGYYPKLFEEIETRFRRDYVCPNPNCQHFLGNQPFEELRKTKKCFSCGCECTE